jgi:uncharacterized damage-inducible protein DinB
MTTDVIERMYSHLDWANQRLMALVERDPERTRPAMHLVSHLLAAERVWLLRLRNENSSGQSVWPTLSPETLSGLAAENRDGYARLIATLSEDALAREVVYTNQSGRAFRTRVDDILIHVATHGAYHRGQIAAAVRAAGGEPVNTDYITYVRESGSGIPARVQG